MRVGDEPDAAVRPRRRSFTAEYKAAILDEYDQLPVGAPERGALLRREGLYTSHIAEWRKQRDAAALDGLVPKTRRARRSREQTELDKLRERNAKLGAARKDTAGAGDHGKSACALGAALRERGHRAAVAEVIDGCFNDLERVTSTARACALWGKSRASHYRREAPPRLGPPTPPNKLTEQGRQRILAVLRSEAYCDLAPAQVWAQLLDDGSTCARSRRCTDCSRRPGRPANDAANARIPRR